MCVVPACDCLLSVAAQVHAVPVVNSECRYVAHMWVERFCAYGLDGQENVLQVLPGTACTQVYLSL